MDEIKAGNQPKTLEELFCKQFIELQESHGTIAQEWLKEKKKTDDLQNIVDMLSEHAKFNGEYISIMVGGISEIKERNFLVKALGLTKEDDDE